MVDVPDAPEFKQTEPAARRPARAPAYAEAPTRVEIDAKLEAAEARTETRIEVLRGGMETRFEQMRGSMETRFEQMRGAMETRFGASDHKFDLLTARIDSLVSSIDTLKSETKADNKSTRNAIWVVGIGSIFAVAGLIVSLWVAQLSIQSNLIAAFQTALTLRPGTPAPASK